MKGAGLVGGVVCVTCQFNLHFNVQEVQSVSFFNCISNTS